MDLKDLILTPFYLVLIYVIAWFLRPRYTDSVTRKYFFPALTVKLIGAIALGVIYQFYYNGGDTYNYFRDSQVIWEAFIDSPLKALGIIFAESRSYHPDLYEYTRRIYFFVDPYSFNVIRLAGFFGMFTFHTYSCIAILFAASSFTGLWALYKVFYTMYPKLHKQLAIAVFFIPSVFFWGSGLMKDTITLGALGWTFYGFYFGLIRRENLVVNITILLINLLIIQAIKVYILLCFLPAAFLWIFLQYRASIKSKLVRIVSLPLIIILALPISYKAVTKITEDNTRYKLENLAHTTKETAEWLTRMGTEQKGSVYFLGEFDGSWSSMISKFPQAVVVALYRPFLWEVKNPVMLLSALEASFLIFLTFKIFKQTKLRRLGEIVSKQPLILFCLVFSITFGFAVGISSYNFGTLVRYKIPLMPFFLAALYIIQSQSVNKPKKVRRFA